MYCQLLKNKHKISIDRAFKQVRIEFPDRKDLLGNIGDMSSVQGCPGHPGNSHRLSNGIDLDYFTFNTNVTQYKNNVGREVTNIWLPSRSKTSVLDINIFDWERNARLWELIYEMTPDVKATVDERIYKYIFSKLDKDRTKKFQYFLRPDDPMHYNHDIHIHFNLSR